MLAPLMLDTVKVVEVVLRGRLPEVMVHRPLAAVRQDPLPPVEKLPVTVALATTTLTASTTSTLTLAFQNFLPLVVPLPLSPPT